MGLRAKLGRSWSQLVQVGPKLGPCWPKLAPSQANVAAMLDRNGAFGRFCAYLQNVSKFVNDHSGELLFGGESQSDRSVRIPRY